MFDNFHFIRPGWLWLIPVIILIWWLARRAHDPLRGWRRSIDGELLKALTVGDTTRDLWQSVGVLAAWLLATIALAGPTWHLEPTPFSDDPVPLMLLLSADESMDLDDLAPSRMERASLKVADIAEDRKGEPLGLIAYAGTAHLVLPPTRDTSVVATMAAEISSKIMPKPGNALVDALQLAARTLKESGGSIIVIADSLPAGDAAALSRFRQSNDLLVQVLSVVPPESIDASSMETAASALNARVTAITPDDADVRALVRRAARAPQSVAAADKGTRWAESGWWLIPILAILTLIRFRRTISTLPKERLA
ncbi:vWA domain-containing protein [Allorhodopirellula solitaria]|uniref:VWFA domain-containing protein n=1 Tax=Allorhodopirellula solitaria TaxID=2527987 RepID=A0A5C5YF36_9BACT|nr:VWA domain-containing protein [Allorhodopirellula solitaria]TWT73121.1 hypothetical protein CA85_15880 [Allorhodopirellula solitaria]